MNFKGGTLLYDDLNVDSNKSFDEQKNKYKENLFQIIYGSHIYVIHVGWCPAFDPNGCFKLVVVKLHNWMNPLLERKSTSLDQLKKDLLEAIDFTAAKWMVYK